MFMYGVYENERKRLNRNAEFRVILWHSITFKMRHLPIHKSIYQITYLKFNQKYLEKKNTCTKIACKDMFYYLTSTKEYENLHLYVLKRISKTLICRKAYDERSFNCS